MAGNALRTGAYAAQVVLPGEDPAHFEELEQQFLRDFAPADVAQSALVHQLAVITWKKLRLDRIEHSHFLGVIQRPFLQLELEPVAHLLPAVGALRWVNDTRHHSPVERDSIFAALRWAGELSLVPEGGYPAGTMTSVRSKAPLLYQHLESEAQDYSPAIAASDWLTEDVSNADGEEGLFVTLACLSFCRIYAAWEWVEPQREAAEQAIRQLQQQRILTSMRQSNVNRIHEDLDRAFQRNLAELRRQQNWRRDRATRTIAPEPGQPSAGA
ncbi:hypothetical protein C380_03175 [Acidovorax sp. KKS102]|uniref:hypothetical protein n=1 Tax=Acidovorax sp. KKS102 TaxID=358220 RepID=UPI00028AE72F|nr:hypothetical protein [Acidovorax sp. KKS102]AFU44361.1 hypothetical protein C380_03175 [Acidovorax sp. KKS102]